MDQVSREADLEDAGGHWITKDHRHIFLEGGRDGGSRLENADSASEGENFLQRLHRSVQERQTEAGTSPKPEQGAVAQRLSTKAEAAILNSDLRAEQAEALERAVVSAGTANGIDPNILVGIIEKESSFDPTAMNKTHGSTASGLFQLTAGVRSDYGLSAADARGSSPAAITNQVNAAAKYFADLMKGPVPASHPNHRLEIALGYFRGSREAVNRAMVSKEGYAGMLKLRYGGETLGAYIRHVELLR